MKKHLTGQIFCRGLNPSRTVRRFIEKKIGAWLETRAATNGRYRVFIRRDAPGHVFDCRIEIEAGRNIFLGVEYGRDLHQALLRCLNHLIPVPPQPPRPALALAV